MSLQSEVEALAGELGLRVRAARIRRGWTARDLAAKLGVSERTVRKLEKGAISVGFGTALTAGVLLDVDFASELSRHVAHKRARPRAPDISATETDF